MPRQKDASKSLTLDKRSKIMIGVLAVVLVAAGAFFLLKNGGSSNTASNPVVPKASASASPKASPTPKVTPKVTPSPAVTADSTRDPFQPLVQEAVATTSSSPAATATPAPSPASSAPAAGSHSVGLVTITGTTASITYNNSPARSVKAGATIATGVTVVKVDPDSIFISYGNKLYAVAPGQTVTF